VLGAHAVLEDPKDKYFISGYGSEQFDKPFMQDLFIAAGQRIFGDWFYSASLDSMVLAAQVLRSERQNMQNFKLETVARRLNIEVDPQLLHKADYDVCLHYDVYSVLSRGLPQ
jgi:DNA polymerase III epsilon subunit-like protein